MALPKLFERIFWHNNTTPAINEDNLNAMSKGLSDVDDRVIELAGTIMEDVPAIQEYLSQADELVDQMEELSTNPPYIGANGNWYVWNTTTGAYVDSGVDASISVTIADITMINPAAPPYVTNTGTDTDPIFHLFIPRGQGIAQTEKIGTSGLVDTYRFVYSDGSEYQFTVTNGKTAYQYAVDGGYAGTEAQFETDLGNFQTYASNAQQGASDAEAYAKGTRGGTAVDSSDPAYHNNAQYFAGQADTSAQAAAGSALDAEAYANGTRNGTDVTSEDEAYHNNSKYWSDLAAQYAQSFQGAVFRGSIYFTNLPTSGMNNGDWYDIKDAFVTTSDFEEGSGISCAAGTDIIWVAADNKWNILTPSGVHSFNGRMGAVSPAANDYDATKIQFGSNSNVNTELGNKLPTYTADPTAYDTEPTVSSTKPVTSGGAKTYIDNKHKVTRFEVSTSSWTSDTSSQSGSTLYKKSIALSHVYVDVPSIDIGATGTLPTTAQQTAYDLLKYVTIDGTTLYLYASATPSSSFYINVEGVD